MSRDTIPFEVGKTDQARPINDFLRGIQRAVVQSTDPDTGRCTIEFESTPGSRANVGIALGLMTVGAENERRRSAWSRRIPSPGDIVLVGFDANGLPRILGADQPSYEILANLNAEEAFTFKAIKSGEFDERSIGGAYIYGKATGDLFLAGGLASLTLEKESYGIQGRAGYLRHQATASVLRFGQVRRTPLPFLPESNAIAGVGVPPLNAPLGGVTPPLSEFSVLVKSSLPGSPLGQGVVDFLLGTVMDPDVEIITQGAYAAAATAGIKKFAIAPVANARLYLRVYDSIPITDVPVGTPGPLAGTPARPFEWGVDQLGNSYMNQGALASAGWNLYAPTALNLVSNQVQLAGNVFLGGSAITPLVTPVGVSIPPITKPEYIAGGPAVCGTPFVAALTAFNAALAAFAGIAAAGTAVTTPADAIAYCKALGGAAAGLIAAASAFTTSAPTWLSNTVWIAKSGPPGVPTVVTPGAAFRL